MESQWNKDRQHDWNDFNNELSGLEVGRPQRFLTDNEVDAYGDDRKKKEERRHLSRIEQLLMDEAYKAAYQDAMRSLYETQHAVYEALKESAQELALAEALNQDILDRASTLSDGTRVFLDDDGSAYTEDGRKLTEEEFGEVEWRDDSPRWTEFKNSTDTLDKARDRNDQMQRHSDRVEEIERELDDHPDSQKRVDELKDELDTIINSVDNTAQKELTLQSETPAVLPTLSI